MVGVCVNRIGTEPFICKVDIEGGEEFLFSKNTEWVARFPVIIVELHDWMLPWQRNSRNFLKRIANLDFDIIWRGENMFCFNYNLLHPSKDQCDVSANKQMVT